MIYWKYVSLCFLLCVFVQCYKNDSFVKNTKTLKVDLNDTTSVSIFDIFSSVEILPLETNKSSLINEISKIIDMDSMLYIFDRKQAVVLCFSADGKFKFKINEKGHGSREYREIRDCQYNSYRHSLEILEPWGKLFEYTLDGKYISTIKLPHPPSVYHLFMPLNQDSILLQTLTLHEDDANILRIYSRSKNKIITEFYNKPRYRYVGETEPLFDYKNKVYFSSSASNTVEEIQGNFYMPAYQWDFGNHQIAVAPKDVRHINSQEELEIFFEKIANCKEFPYLFLRNDQNEQYFHCTVNLYRKILNVFYSKKKDAYKVFCKTKEGVILYPISISDQYIICILPPSHKLKDIVPISVLTESDKKYIYSYSSEKNPFLIKYNFK